MIESIETIEQLVELVVAGFSDWQRYGFVTVRKYGDLLVFNYSPMAIYSQNWNSFERMSRGLIIHHKTGEIVARSFDKFFNWGESGRFSSAPIVRIMEKLDGSLGLLYRHEGYRIATRGTLDSPQSQWATDFLNQQYQLDGLPNELTLMFEIIYPDNRIVLDYGERQDLVLLAGRNRFTGEYLPFEAVKIIAGQYGFSLPRIYEFTDVDTMMKELDAAGSDFEGYVAEFADGQRFKFKGRRYLELHKLITRLTFKNVCEAMENNSLEALLGMIPDEFLGETKAWIAEIEGVLASETARLKSIFELVPKQNRKDFALWVNQFHKADSKYLFLLLDGKEITSLIFRQYNWRQGDTEALDDDSRRV